MLVAGCESASRGEERVLDIPSPRAILRAVRPKTIRDIVSVPEHPTVVRLDALFVPGTEWIEESYCLTEDVRGHLRALRGALGEPAGKGIFVIGQYGSGKSHLLAWVITKLRQGDFLPEGPAAAFVSLVNYSAANRLEDIVCETLGIRGAAGDRRVAFSALRERYENGLVLVLDELSEFLRSKPDHRAFNEDVRFLQFLGEWAAGNRFWIIGAIQESIERTGDIEYDLYRKIKDRYPLRLILSPAHIRDLIADGVLIKGEGYEAAVAEVVQKLERATPEGLAVDRELLLAIYPLHPATLVLLEEVRDKFSQARGVIDFAVTRLRGDAERGVTPFLDRPFGDLLTPDIIIDHYTDLLAIQPEFLPLSDKVFPYYDQNLEKLVAKASLRELSRRLLKLLALVSLSRSRKGLTPAEATYWLGFSAIQITPEKNVQVVAAALDRLATAGQFVKISGERYFLDTEEDSAGAFAKLLRRELAQLDDSEETVLEELIPLLPGRGVNPLSLPREAWQARDIRWHHHDRRCYIYVGNDEPPPRSAGEITLCVRLPFGDAGVAREHHTVIPTPLAVTDAVREAVACGRLLSKPLDRAVSERAAGMLTDRATAVARQVSDAYCRGQRLAPSGRGKFAPPAGAFDGTDSWLADNLRWVLGRTYPAFESVAPTAGPLPLETHRAFIRFLTENDVDAPASDREVDLVREAYLVPMGLLKGTPRGYHLPRNLERHELIKLAAPLIDNGPAPKTLYDYLAGPVYGLVPDQIHLLLLFLYFQGEIDITKDKRSLEDLFETFPTPLKYDRIEKGGGLEPRVAAALDQLCAALGIKPAAGHTVLAERQAAARAAAQCRVRTEPLSLLAVNLAATDDTGALVTRIRRLLDWTRALTQADDPLEGFAQLVYEAESVPRYIEELEALKELPDHIHRLISERDRFQHLLAGVAENTLSDENAAVLLENLGPPPGLDAIEDLARWIAAASNAYAVYTRDYSKRHERMIVAVEKHPAWRWRPPALTRLRQARLEPHLERCRELEAEAARRRCRGLSNLAFQPVCACGFDGHKAPVQEILERLAEEQRSVDQILTRFFARAGVRRKVAEFAEARDEARPALRAYLEQQAPLPDIQDLRAFEKHLAGFEIVSTVDLTALAGVLTGRTWTRAALLEAVSRAVGTDDENPIRFDPMPVGGVPPAVAAWCVRQALATGTPLPPGLDEERLADAVKGLDPTGISAAALARIDRLGLPQETVLRLLRGLADGTLDITLPKERSPLVTALLEMVEEKAPKRTNDYIDLLARACSATEILKEAVATPWLAHLERLTHWPGLEALPKAVAVLEKHTKADWILVDALGLPFVPAFTDLLDELLPGVALSRTTFARWEGATTTSNCYDGLAAAGVQHRFHKIDSLDALLHERSVPFDDLVKLAAAELGIAFKRLRPALDPARALVVFADHGCRPTPDGKGFVHGGDSPLEAAVPFFHLVPRT